MASDETSIKVSVGARDRLATLAAEHGTGIRGLVEDIAQSTPTRAEHAPRGAGLRPRCCARPRGRGEGTTRAGAPRRGATRPSGRPLSAGDLGRPGPHECHGTVR